MRNELIFLFGLRYTTSLFLYIVLCLNCTIELIADYICRKENWVCINNFGRRSFFFLRISKKEQNDVKIYEVTRKNRL